MTAVKLSKLARELGLCYQGDDQVTVSGVATLAQADQTQIAFYNNPKYHSNLLSTKAGAVILRPAASKDFQGNALLTDNPYLVYAKVAAYFIEKKPSFIGVHASVVMGDSVACASDVRIAPNVVIGDRVTLKSGVLIGPNTVIGNDVTIGEGTELKAGVTLCDKVVLGKACLIHSGAVIGCDGFGNAKDGKAWVKVPQLGGVKIGDDVEIGANTTIDCGAIEDTEIADGVRLDNLIQVAHNVKIGRYTAIAACTGIAGSTHIGENCMIGGNVGISGHLHITDNVIITGMTMVISSLLKPGVYSSGIPVAKSREWRRNVVRFKQLDAMAKRLKQLENEMKK